LRNVAPTPLILDVDTGVDDAMALLLAAASPEVELVGATCVMGNVTLEQATLNTLAVLELAGLQGVEVAPGAARPLVRDHQPYPEVHGERGLGHANPPAPVASSSDRSATSLIVENARTRPGELLLVATGPLTNIATAIAEEPRLPDLLRGFAIMGGAFAKAGNVSPTAESNVWVDPEAAQAVFRAFAGAPVERLPLCAGLDVTDRVRMSRAHVAEIGAPAPDTALARFVHDAVAFYIDFYESFGPSEGASMHDPLALAIAIDPSFVELATTRVEVECDGRWTRGMSVADLAGVRRTPWALGWDPQENARVALEVDADRFMAWFVGRLRDLVEARA
jgi:purine nucleosidase